MASTYREDLNSLGYYEALPKPSVDELALHYRTKYYQNAQGTYSKEYSPEELRHFRNIANVANLMSTKYGIARSLLDLGCGEGFFSRSFQILGWDVSCCDFSEFGIAKHNRELLPFFSAGEINECIERYKSGRKVFGLVNLQNVLEHVVDPIALLRGLVPLLGEGGSVLRIRVPNDYSEFQAALVENGHTRNTWFAPPEHLSYFNKAGLKTVLEHCGYRLLSLQVDFPIEVFLANPHSNYWKDRTLGKGAHAARVFCENHLIERDIDAYVEYSEAAAKLGFGRELIAYATSL